LSDSKRKPFLLRVSDALRALSTSGEEARAIIPTTYPNFGAGTQQMQLVRTADPSEYRRDGRTVRIQGFNAHPVVHACMRVIADIVASVPLVVLKEKGDYESRVGADHPLQRLLDYPGPRFTARQFRARFAVDFLGYGNAFFTMNRTNPNRAPFSLSPVNPESIQQVWIDTEGDPRRYDYANWAGIIVNVPTEDMLHFRDLEMGRPFEADVFGYPRGATAIGSLLADNEATQYVRQVVTNDGTPTFAVLMADEASTEDAVAMQDRYTARVVDRGKRGVPAFFGAVKDIKPLGFTLSDLEFPDLRRVSREDICAAFGVDPRMVGIASASSDGGLSGIQYAEARARLVQHTIEPLFSAFEDELNHWLAPEFGEVWVTYDHDMLRDLVENDTETSTRVRAEFQASLRTWEESRRALKLSPIPEPTDTLLSPMGATLIPAAVAVIDPSTILDQPPATDNEAPQIAPTQAEDEAEEMEEPETDEEIEDEDEAEEEVEDESEDEDESRAEEVTNFPEDGDDKKVTLRNSQYQLFPVGEAENLKENWPDIWRKGGNIKGNEQFAKLAPLAKRGGTPDGEAEENAIRLREAWVARHRGDFQLAGVVAQIKWLSVGDRGLDHMRAVIREAKEKSEGRSEMVDERRARWERANAELDRTEVTYKATAEALFRAERPKVTREISSAPSFAEARQRVLNSYRVGGDLEQNWQESFTPLVAKTYAFGATEVAGAGAELAADTVESGLAGRSVQSVREAIRKRTQRLAQLIGDTTAREVLAVIEASERGGLTVTETARLVSRAVYGEEKVGSRSTAIARTESAGALSQGSWDQAKEMGDLYRSKEWLAFSDAETRESHTACMAQGRIAIDQPFQNGLMFPLDPSGSAAEVINCRCVLAYSDEPV
jgi:HK97 family phage portal protein